jgi:hypothetical protein
MTTVELTPSVQKLLDKQEIHDALMRYARGVDRCDPDLMRSVYHPDAFDHHGPFQGNGWEFVEQFIPSSRETSTFTQHLIGNLLIEVEGDRAHSEAYFVAYVGRIEEGEELIGAFGGRYVDQWERRNDRWGVSHREVEHEWSRGDAVGSDPFELSKETFAQPVRGREDLAFVR